MVGTPRILIISIFPKRWPIPPIRSVLPIHTDIVAPWIWLPMFMLKTECPPWSPIPLRKARINMDGGGRDLPRAILFLKMLLPIFLDDLLIISKRVLKIEIPSFYIWRSPRPIPLFYPQRNGGARAD